MDLISLIFIDLKTHLYIIFKISMIEEFLFYIIVVFYRLIHYFFMYQFIYEVFMKYLSIYSLYIIKIMIYLITQKSVTGIECRLYQLRFLI